MDVYIITILVTFLVAVTKKKSDQKRGYSLRKQRFILALGLRWYSQLWPERPAELMVAKSGS